MKSIHATVTNGLHSKHSKDSIKSWDKINDKLIEKYLSIVKEIVSWISWKKHSL